MVVPPVSLENSGEEQVWGEDEDFGLGQGEVP